jgi:Flp pilus assembly protein TadG
MMRACPPRLAADARGAAIIELALVAPILGLMVVGIVDLSNAFSHKLALEQGAQRAIEKIMQTTGTTTVEDTVKTEAVCQVNGLNSDGTCKSSPIASGNVTVTYRLECTASGGAITTQTSADSTTFDAFTCDSGTLSEARYIEVAVTDTYTPMFPIHFSFIDPDGTYHLSATAGMRTQ